MRNETEDLWYNYLERVVLQKSDKEIELIKESAKKEDALRKTLSNKQKELLEEYKSANDTFHHITEKHAFAKGIKFTTRLLVEALCED